MYNSIQFGHYRTTTEYNDLTLQKNLNVFEIPGD